MSITTCRTAPEPVDGTAPTGGPEPVASAGRALRGRGRSHRMRGLRAMLAVERGAATAEYAVATMAAVGFAGLLVVILRGEEVRGILTDLVRNALTVG
ncbi:DUF4244 domain-containing protein [Agromyces terreus]